MAAFSEAAALSQDIKIERRLAAILAADVAGFRRLTEADEIGTLRMLAAQRAILDDLIGRTIADASPIPRAIVCLPNFRVL